MPEEVRPSRQFSNLQISIILKTCCGRTWNRGCDIIVNVTFDYCLNLTGYRLWGLVYATFMAFTGFYWL